MVRRLAAVLAVLAMLVLASCGDKISSDATAGAFGDAESLPVGSDQIPTQFAFSPDGNRFGYLETSVLRRDSRVVVVQEGRQKLLTPSDLDVMSWSWMPDSRSVLVAHRVGDRDELAVIGPDGNVARRVMSDRAFRAEEGMTVRGDGALAVVAGGPPGHEQPVRTRYKMASTT